MHQITYGVHEILGADVVDILRRYRAPILISTRTGLSRNYYCKPGHGLDPVPCGWQVARDMYQAIDSLQDTRIILAIKHPTVIRARFLAFQLESIGGPLALGPPPPSAHQRVSLRYPPLAFTLRQPFETLRWDALVSGAQNLGLFLVWEATEWMSEPVACIRDGWACFC